MNSGWSQQNRTSRDGNLAPNTQPSRGNASRPSTKDRTLSSSSVKQKNGQSRQSLSTSRSHSPSRDATSRSNNATSKGEKPRLELQDPDKQSHVRFGTLHLRVLADGGGLLKCMTPQSGMPQIALAVVGTPGSGKSTFIQHALDLKKTPTSTVSSKKVSLEGVVSLLRIHEFNIEAVDTGHEGTLQWPQPGGEEIACRIDGTVIIYSISDASSTKMIPSFLRTCAKSGMPTVLVCSNCDVPSKLRQVDSQTTEQLRSGVVGNIQVYQSSIKAPDSHKRCLSFVLRNIGLRNTVSTNRELHGHWQPLDAARSQASQVPSSSIPVHHDITQPGSPEHTSGQSVQTGVAPTQKRADMMDVNDECAPDSQHEQQQKQPLILLSEPTSKSDDVDNSDDALKNAGVGFDELVDRLLSNSATKVDLKFVAIFLCLYRQFSAPSNLLNAVIFRFNNNVDACNMSQAIRNTAQLRYLGVLAEWVSEYPGDFAHPLTRLRMEDFISGLAGHRTFSMVTKEIMLYLDVVSEDDDTTWACSDEILSGSDTVASPSRVSSIPSAFSITNAGCSMQKTKSGESESPAPAPARISATPSNASSAGKSSTQSFGSVQGQSAVEIAQSQARRLVPCPRITLCKVHWHLFMKTSDEDIAQELTRIDWIMYSSIKPRDLVRHVSLAETDREKYKSLENVTRMIHQFNHIAFWIANVILLRDKPKHRAKALEKCMAIAW
ncbi:MAG: hypothetical protein Q9169_008003, partial [Polycauliona sp. 2 TL-2023]